MGVNKMSLVSKTYQDTTLRLIQHEIEIEQITKQINQLNRKKHKLENEIKGIKTLIKRVAIVLE